jgi:hypothetical protein
MSFWMISPRSSCRHAVQLPCRGSQFADFGRRDERFVDLGD